MKMWMLYIVTDDTLTKDGYKEMLDEWVYDHPGYMVLDYLWGYKHGHISIVVSDSKDGSNEAIFERHEYYGALLNTDT